MKKYLILLPCSFLLADPAAAQLSAKEEANIQKSTAISLRANMLEFEAVSRAMEQCSTARVAVPLPHFDELTDTETTVDTIVSIEWSGACVDGKRDGAGVLTWTKDTTNNFRINQTTNLEIREITSTRSEGRFVKGQRLGMWCMTTIWSLTSKPDDGFPRRSSESGCSVFAGNMKQLTSNYRKQSDGSWMDYLFGVARGSSLAPGTLEAQSAKVLADAAAGKTMQISELVVQNRALDDLVRGSKIVLTPRAGQISLKDKRIGVVLSTNTIVELERFKRERQALIISTSGFTGEGARVRANFIAASNPDRLLTNVAKVLKRYAREVQPADDLSGLKNAGFDYALVVDWKYTTRLDLLGKFDDFPSGTHDDMRSGKIPPLYGESLSGFLISTALEAVREYPSNSLNQPKHQSTVKGDSGYLSDLAGYYRVNWGSSEDDLGIAITPLQQGLQY